MQLSNDVYAFTSACERLLAAGAIYRPLSPDEVTLRVLLQGITVCRLIETTGQP